MDKFVEFPNYKHSKVIWLSKAWLVVNWEKFQQNNKEKYSEPSKQLKEEKALFKLKSISEGQTGLVLVSLLLTLNKFHSLF